MVKRYEIKIYFILLCVRRYFLQLPAILMLAFENQFQAIFITFLRIFNKYIKNMQKLMCMI